MQNELSTGLEKIAQEGIGEITNGRAVSSQALVPYQGEKMLEQASQKYRTVLSRLTHRAQEILHQTMRESRAAFSYKDYTLGEHHVEANAGDGLGQMTIAITYKAEKKTEGKIRKRNVGTHVTLSGAIKSYGPDVAIPETQIFLPGAWSVEGHNELEGKLVDYVHLTATQAHARLATLSREKVSGVSMTGAFEAELVMNLSRTLGDPSFMGAYERKLGERNLQQICAELERTGKAVQAEYAKALEAVVEEQRTAQKNLDARVSEAHALLDQQVEKERERISQSAQGTLGRLSAYEATTKSQLETTLLAETQKKQGELSKKCADLETDYARRAQQIETDLAAKRKVDADPTDYLSLYIGERVNRTFTQVTYSYLEDSDRISLHTSLVNFSRSGKSKLHAASLMSLVETIKDKVTEGTGPYNYLKSGDASGIVALASWVAERADTNALTRIMNGIQSLNGGNRTDLAEVQKTLKALIG